MAKKDPENYIALEGGYNMSMTAMVGNVSPEHMSSAKLKVRRRGEKIIELLQNIVYRRYLFLHRRLPGFFLH